MQKIIRTAKQLVREKRIKQTGTIFEVDEHIVRIVKKKGRTLLICDCFNDTKFCVESPMCLHKLSVLVYLINDNFYKKIDKIIFDYEGYKMMKGLVPSIDCFLNDLENLRRVK